MRRNYNEIVKDLNNLIFDLYSKDEIKRKKTQRRFDELKEELHFTDNFENEWIYIDDDEIFVYWDVFELHKNDLIDIDWKAQTIKISERQQGKVELYTEAVNYVPYGY